MKVPRLRGVPRAGILAASALVALVAYGCSTTISRTSYVKDASVTLSDIPLAPAVVRPEMYGKMALGVRAGFRDPASQKLPLRVVTEGDPPWSNQSYRSTYTVNRGAYQFGLDLRHAPLRYVDMFLSSGFNTGRGLRGNGLLGFGLSIPFPALTLRMGPAFGLHSFSGSAVDSSIYRSTLSSPFGETDVIEDTVVTNRRYSDSRQFVWAFSVSAWPTPSPQRAWSPFVQYQVQRVNMNDNEIPEGTMTLNSHILATGFEHAIGKRFLWNTRLAREFMSNRHGSDVSYRLETGVSVLFTPPED